MPLLVKVACSISVHLGCNSNLLSQTFFNCSFDTLFLDIKGSAQFSKLSENTIPEVNHYDQIFYPIFISDYCCVPKLNWGAVQASNTGSCVLDSLRDRYETENMVQS